MTIIDLPVLGRAMPTYVATPPGEAPCPAVVVIHDILGMTHDLHSQADWLASEGYLVAAPDLFDGGTVLGCVRTVMRDFSRREGPLFEKIEATRQWLLHHERSTGKLGVIGFCLGGGFALLLAPRGEYDVASVNYGSIPERADDLLERACPIIASYGGEDRMLKGAAADLETILTNAGVEHDIKEYPGAGHDFMTDHSRDRVPFLIKVVAAVLGGDYEPEAAEDSRRRIRDFFARHLKGSAV